MRLGNLLSAAALWAVFLCPVLAQTIPNHAVPISRGPGVTGQHALGPCNADVPLAGKGSSADPDCMTGQLSVSLGGTGNSTLTSHALIFGAGTSAVVPYTCTGFLVGTGASVDPTCRSIAGSDIPNPSATTLGGIESKTCSASQWLNSISTSGVPSCTQPAVTDISGGAAVTRTNDTNVTLTLGGTPTTSSLTAWSMTLGWSGTLAVSRGGTGIGSGTSGGITYFSSSSAIASSGALTANGPVYGGGAGGSPASMAAGTNGQIIVGQTSAAPAWKTLSGDCTLTSLGAITCTKTSGSSFVASATTDTTSASNISSGTLNTARLPSPFTSGTASGSTSKFATTTGTLTSGNCAKWDASGNIVDAGAACGTGSGGSITSFTNALSSSVATNASTYTDGPSVSQGTSGTFFVSGHVTVEDTAAARTFNCKLWDGTTVIASGQMQTTGAAVGGVIALSGILASPAANIKISCIAGSGTTGIMAANLSGAGKDSVLTALKIQ